MAPYFGSMNKMFIVTKPTKYVCSDYSSKCCLDRCKSASIEQWLPITTSRWCIIWNEKKIQFKKLYADILEDQTYLSVNTTIPIEMGRARSNPKCDSWRLNSSSAWPGFLSRRGWHWYYRSISPTQYANTLICTWFGWSTIKIRLSGWLAAEMFYQLAVGIKKRSW